MRQIEDHLCRAYPEEGCGALIGRESEGAREVTRVVGFENRAGERRRQRYTIAPEQFLDADRRARAAALEVLGFFHSHPDAPAEPSAFDLEHAWDYYSYLIVSVARGAVTEPRAWRLRADRAGFEPETLEILDPAVSRDPVAETEA
jgi:proteasome lid subunit RPN8/RPN11